MLGIGVLKLMGSSAASASGVNLNNAYVFGMTAAQWRIDNDGFTYENGVQKAAWISPQSGMSLYDVRATLLSGDVPPGSALATWLNLGTDRTWGWAGPITSAQSTSLKIEIRLTSTGSILDSATVNINVAGSDF